MKRSLSILCLVVLITVAVMPVCAFAGSKKYVWNSHSSYANIRSAPNKQSTVLMKAPNGTALKVQYYVNSTWACVTLASGSDDGFIMRRFLSNSASHKKSSAKPASSSAGSGKLDISTLFSKFSHVAPYSAYVKTGVSGTTVPLRWGPSKQFKIMDHLYDGEPLTVIAEGQYWDQVRDDNTGYTGFISKTNIEK